MADQSAGGSVSNITHRLVVAWAAFYRVLIPLCLSIMTLIMIASWVESYYWKYGTFTPLILHLPVENGGKIPVLNADKTVCTGSDMVYGFDFDKTMDVSCTIKRQLVDGSLIMFEPVDPPRKPLGLQSAIGNLPIPKRTDTKEWFMRWTAECKVGPNERVIPTTAVSEKFHVKDCDKPERGPKGDKGNPGPPGKNFWGR
jgi:hypothetical protein